MPVVLVYARIAFLSYSRDDLTKCFNHCNNMLLALPVGMAYLLFMAKGRSLRHSPRVRLVASLHGGIQSATRHGYRCSP